MKVLQVSYVDRTARAVGWGRLLVALLAFGVLAISSIPTRHGDFLLVISVLGYWAVLIAMLIDAAFCLVAFFSPAIRRFSWYSLPALGIAFDVAIFGGMIYVDLATCC